MFLTGNKMSYLLSLIFLTAADLFKMMTYMTSVYLYNTLNFKVYLIFKVL